MDIIIKNLYKSFGTKEALKDVSLVIHEGMFGLLGRNGAGKTTLMRIISTLINKTKGDITVCGIDINESKKVRALIGYLPQEFSSYPNLTVWETMDYFGVLSEMSKAERRAIIPKILKEVNLDGYSKVKVKALSGGMKRRLGIAQAIMHNPKVLIVDEPTAGLDPEERIRFRNLLCQIAKERIVILSTHIVGDIEATCEDVAILDKGNVLYTGTVKELINRAKGKVYSKTISISELEEVKRNYEVTGMLTLGNEVVVRVLSNEVLKDFQLCDPNVEDAYMLTIGGI